METLVSVERLEKSIHIMNTIRLWRRAQLFMACLSLLLTKYTARSRCEYPISLHMTQDTLSWGYLDLHGHTVSLLKPKWRHLARVTLFGVDDRTLASSPAVVGCVSQSSKSGMSHLVLV
jgi:hypothetical protein